MKVLLRKDIEGVGRRGDIVDVAGGYARNFLLPSGSAQAASESTAIQAAAMRRSRDLRDAKDLESAATQKAALEMQTLVIPARAGDKGKLFGSVGPTEIAAALAQETGVAVDRHQVVLAEHLKELGEVSVPVKLFGDVEATVTVSVVAQD